MNMKKIINNPFKLKPIKKSNLKPISKLKSISNPFKLKPVMKPAVKLSIYHGRRTKQEWKLIGRNPLGDKDKDGVRNMFDCRPLNRKLQSKLFRDYIKNKYKIQKIDPTQYKLSYIANKIANNDRKVFYEGEEGKIINNINITHGFQINKNKLPKNFNFNEVHKGIPIEDIKILNEKDILHYFEKRPEEVARLESIDSITFMPTYESSKDIEIQGIEIIDKDSGKKISRNKYAINRAAYSPSNKIIKINPIRIKKDIIDSDLLHESSHHDDYNVSDSSRMGSRALYDFLDGEYLLDPAEIKARRMSRKKPLRKIMKAYNKSWPEGIKVLYGEKAKEYEQPPKQVIDYIETPNRDDYTRSLKKQKMQEEDSEVSVKGSNLQLEPYFKEEQEALQSLDNNHNMIPDEYEEDNK